MITQDKKTTAATRTMQRFCYFAIYALLALPAALTAGSAASERDYLIALYEHLHKHPELSFQEQETSARIAHELEMAGFRVTTGELNRLLARAVQANAPKPDRGRREVRILFGSQIGTAPPTFALSVNQPVDLHFSYRRYLENRIRKAFGFEEIQ